MISKGPLMGKKIALLEKEWFPWRRNRLVRGRPAFFPGCNLVNFLPRTARETVKLFNALDAGWLYACCGKPLQMANDEQASDRVLERIKGQLTAAGVTELIVACPNCHAVFQKALGIPVKDIFTFLKEREIPCVIRGTALQTFPPCPDRGTGTIRKAISEWTGGPVQEAAGLPCCGLGISDPEKSRKALATIRSAGLKMSPYCASCYGHLKAGGVDMEPHILSVGLGLAEAPSQGLHKAFNRMRPWFWK